MNSTNRRLFLLSVSTVGLFGMLVVRLFDLQILRYAYYEAVATSQRKRAYEIMPRRGSIYMQEGAGRELFPVAVNRKAYVAYAVPRDMPDPLQVARELAPALLSHRQRQQQRVREIIAQTGQLLATSSPAPTTVEQPSHEDQLAILQDELYGRFNQKTDPYEPFLRFYEVMDDELKQFLTERNLPGIVLEEQEIRTYPEKTLAAHMLGYVGWQDDRKVGRYGIEGFFEEKLSGDLGFLSAEQDTRGRFIGVGASEFRPAENGADIILTVDRVVQSIIENELAEGVHRYGAQRGSIVVMDPKTGSLLGMATYPTFDPNYYFAITDSHVQLNPVVSEIFEPGSILKPIIMTAAIEEQKVKPDTTFIDSGPVRVAKYTIDTYDGKHHGVQTMVQVLEQSNNVGMVWVGQQLGAATMYDYLRRFGLGERTAIELEGETQSALAAPDDWNVATVATVSFGQGVALTPLQALNAINVLANEGQLMQPYMVSRIQHSDGRQQVTQPTVVRQAISRQTATTTSAMLVSVIENGVAQLARVPGYYLAGKTGTAQVPDEQGRYSKDRKIISFVGYGPVRNPRFSILIKLDDPKGLSFASGTTAPMFRNIAEKLLNYYQVLPDYDPALKRPDFQVPTTGGREAFVPTASGIMSRQAYATNQAWRAPTVASGG